MSINGGLFTSLTCEWSTPTALIEQLSEEFYFMLDVCADDTNAQAPDFFDYDGLNQDWVKPSRGGACWMNPPYGNRIKAWVRKAYEESERGATVVCLLPSRTDTEWWHEFCMKGEIRFIRGRLCFGGNSNPAPFPSAIVIFRPTK